MFASYIKWIFVLTAYAPIILIVWSVDLYNVLNEGCSLVFVEHWKEIFNKLNLIWLFIALFFVCIFLIKYAEKKLTKNKIELKSIKSADFNMNSLLISYFLPCIELFTKGDIYIIVWVIILLILVCFNKGTYFYNPILKLFGYKYYEIATKNEVTFTMISKRKIINTKNVNSYSQLTDYVILNAT